jgi:hypothetical protein
MIISDLNYLEVVAQSDRVEGGLLNIGSYQSNDSWISQGASANSGSSSWYGGGVAIGNIAAAANVAAPVQVNA